MLLALTTKGRFFRSLGSQYVRLNWDVSRRTISLTVLNKNGTVGETLFNVPVSRIKRASIANGSYVLQIDDRLYDLEVPYHRGFRALWSDVIRTYDVGDVAAAYIDTKNGSSQLIDFLREELSEGILRVSPYRANTRLKASIVIVMLVVAVFVAVAIAGYASGS
jgi:hypothetical protein